MKLSYKSKVNLGVSIFVVWMLAQFFRAFFWGEPYPAIYLPGFPGRGNKPIQVRELYVKEGSSFELITHYNTPFGHRRFSKLLGVLVESISDGDSIKSSKQIQGLMSIARLEKGDSILIKDIEWVLVDRKYSPIPKKEYLIGL